jgi:hypothetical protein
MVWYTGCMLTYCHHDLLGEDRLYIRIPRGEAWIAKIPRLSPEHRDWEIWVRHHQSDAAQAAKSPIKLEIERELRHWLFRRYRRHLFTLDFASLRAIAEREAQGTRPRN